MDQLEQKLKECKKNSLFRDKNFITRHPEEIKMGDIVQLMPGTTIPADGIIIKGKELLIEEFATDNGKSVKNLFEDSLFERDSNYKK